MTLRHDRRGQSVVIGTVILFGFLVLTLAVYQAQFVPQENTDVEFEHSQAVEGDFVDLRNALLSAGTTGDARSTSLQLGTRYPQRTFFVNPPPATGQLSTSDTRELRIENATVSGDGNVEAFWSARNLTFQTRSLRYSPGYNEFRNGPDLVYEHSLVVAEFDDAALGRTGQTAVAGERNRIRLTALDGSLRQNGVERESVDPETLSGNRRSVTLESETGDPIVLELPTDVSTESGDDLETVWEDRLGENVERVTVEEGAIRISLDGSETYRLELAKVGVGTGATTPNESNGYITDVSTSGGVAVAEVRDRYNNPVEGAEVTVEEEGEPIDDSPLVTDEDGRVERPLGFDRLNLSINGAYDDAEEWERLQFPSFAESDGAGGGGGGGNINPGGESDVVLADIGAERSGGDTIVDLQFRNRGDEDRQFQFAAFKLLYDEDGDTSDTLFIEETGQVLELRGGLQELDEPLELPAGGTSTITVVFEGEDHRNDLLGMTFVTDEFDQGLYLAGMEGEIIEGSNFEVTIDDTNSPVEEGETLQVDATIENTGDTEDTQTVELAIDGEGVVDEASVTLGAGDSQTETFEWVTETGDAGEYTATVSSEDDDDQRTVEVVEELQSADRVGRIDGSENVQSNNRPQFDFEVTDGTVTVTEASIETKNDFSAIGADGEATFSIGDAEDVGDDTDGNFVYEFNEDNVFDEDDNDIEVDYNNLDTRIENLEFVDDEGNADLVVRVKFDDDSVTEFYLEGDVR